MANATNFKMVNPTACVALFLGFIKGERVQGWTKQQAELLSERIFGEFDDAGAQLAAPTHFDDDEFLWTDMYQTFKRAFAHTTKVEDAFIKLQKCTMGLAPPTNTSQSSMNSARGPDGSPPAEELSKCSN